MEGLTWTHTGIDLEEARSLSVVWPKPEAPSSIFKLKAKAKRRLGGKESEVVKNIVNVCLRQWSSEVGTI